MINDKLTGKEALGIEFGSTRIKAVLINERFETIAQGSYSWENRFEGGYWTYSLDDVKEGLRACFADLNRECLGLFGVEIRSLGSIGISGMMHGYLSFDADGKLLVPFRTWRNTTTSEASRRLTEAFGFNIPQRWSVAHLYQAVLNGEEHVPSIYHINTLAGYVHYLLTGERIVGIGEASGMFPVNSIVKCYDERMLSIFDGLTASQPWKIADLLPEIAVAGENAGCLTEEGALLLDPSGKLSPGAVACPPEGDAGTGMVATNSITPKTGNVSAGTSVFSMVVLEKPFPKVREEIDIVTTPEGNEVAMVHCNNCCSDIDKWAGFLSSALAALGVSKSMSEIYEAFYSSALDGEDDCGGLTVSGLLSGEPVAHLEDGIPALVREKNARFSLANLSRASINSALAILKTGHDILDACGVEIDYLNAHGGLFKSSRSGQRLLANALKTEIRVSSTAAEGGAWGMAVLAAYAQSGAQCSLEKFLNAKVFCGCESVAETHSESGAAGCERYFERFNRLLNCMKGVTGIV